MHCITSRGNRIKSSHINAAWVSYHVERQKCYQLPLVSICTSYKLLKINCSCLMIWQLSGNYNCYCILFLWWVFLPQNRDIWWALKFPPELPNFSHLQNKVNQIQCPSEKRFNKRLSTKFSSFELPPHACEIATILCYICIFLWGGFNRSISDTVVW